MFNTLERPWLESKRKKYYPCGRGPNIRIALTIKVWSEEQLSLNYLRKCGQPVREQDDANLEPHPLTTLALLKRNSRADRDIPHSRTITWLGTTEWREADTIRCS